MYRFNLFVPTKFSYELVYSSLHRNCHHQIIHAKLNLKIFYPPPYEQIVWHYQDVNNDLIQRSISQFNWERAFSNKGVNKQISIFNETILNIMTNFIPHETKIFNDRKPPQINNKVKTMIQEKKQNLSASPLINYSRYWSVPGKH